MYLIFGGAFCDTYGGADDFICAESDKDRAIKISESFVGGTKERLYEQLDEICHGCEDIEWSHVFHFPSMKLIHRSEASPESSVSQTYLSVFCHDKDGSLISGAYT